MEEPKQSDLISESLVLTHQGYFKGFKHHFAALFSGHEVCSAQWAGNKLVCSDCVEFKVRIALGASEQYRCYDWIFHCFSSYQFWF
jgi:hypothetical protein